MKLHKLHKLSNDVDFLDPVTMKKVCSFNQCIDKFVVAEEEIDDRRCLGWGTRTSYFHKCSECGRKITNRQDKRRTAKSAFDALIRGPNAS